MLHFGTLSQARVNPFFMENVSLIKKTRLTETLTMELGAEAFNLFNRHRFNYPTSDFADPNFGFATVSGDPAFYAPRVIQLRVRFTY